MPNDLKTNGDKLSFLISEFKVQRVEVREIKEDQKELKQKVNMIDERLFIKRNGKKSLEAQVDDTAEKMSKHLECFEEIQSTRRSRTWDVLSKFIGYILAVVVGAFAVLCNIPQ